MEKLKELFSQLETFEAETNRLDCLLEEYPDNEEIENQWNASYKKEWEVFILLSDYIVSYTGGKIDAKTARLMIRAKRNELRKLIERIA